MLLMHDVRNSSYHPSSQLADSFEGVAIDDDATDEIRRCNVNAFISLFATLEKMGWYDHTSDWDFHIGLVLTDGRTVEHIGDGASICWAEEADELVHSTADERLLVHISSPRHDEDDPDNDPIREFYLGDAEDDLWAIPVTMIRRLIFGYCT